MFALICGTKIKLRCGIELHFSALRLYAAALFCFRNTFKEDFFMSEQKPKKSKKGLIILVLILVGVFFIGPSILNKNNNKTPSTTNTTNNTTQPVVTTTNQPSTPVTTQATKKDKNDVKVKIKSGSLATDYKGDTILVVTYIFSHTKDDPTSFTLSTNDAAYQNGIECDSTVISDYVDTQTQLNKVKSGVEYEVVVGYHLQDETTDVEIIVNPLFNFSDNPPLCEHTFKLQ